VKDCSSFDQYVAQFDCRVITFSMLGLMPQIFNYLSASKGLGILVELVLVCSLGYFVVHAHVQLQ
jgi:hypothetical protein